MEMLVRPSRRAGSMIVSTANWRMRSASVPAGRSGCWRWSGAEWAFGRATLYSLAKVNAFGGVEIATDCVGRAAEQCTVEFIRDRVAGAESRQMGDFGG